MQSKTVEGYDRGIEFALKLIVARLQDGEKDWREAVSDDCDRAIFSDLDDRAWDGFGEVFSWLQEIRDHEDGGE